MQRDFPCNILRKAENTVRTTRLQLNNSQSRPERHCLVTQMILVHLSLETEVLVEVDIIAALEDNKDALHKTEIVRRVVGVSDNSFHDDVYLSSGTWDGILVSTSTRSKGKSSEPSSDGFPSILFGMVTTRRVLACAHAQWP